MAQRTTLTLVSRRFKRGVLRMRVAGGFGYTVIVLVGLLAMAGLARAQELPPEAQRQIAQGEALFEADNYEAAIAEFQAAYAILDGHPARYFLLWNIGQCNERLFRYDRALQLYRRYLAEGGPEAEDRATVEATMRALEGLLGTIHISTNVARAELWVDDLMVGEAPGDVLLTGGRHTLELRAPGHLPARREIQITARGSLDEFILLEVIPDDTRIDPAWSVLSGVLALASAGVGTGFWVYAQDQWNATRGVDLGDGAQERIDQAALTGDVLFGTAGLFAVTAVVLGFFTRWSGEPVSAPDAQALVVPSPDGVSLWVRGSL